MSGNLALASAAMKVVVQSLKTDDFLYSFKDGESGWDFYKFKLSGEDGTIAVRLVDGTLEIGLFEKGILSEEEARKAISHCMSS